MYEEWLEEMHIEQVRMEREAYWASVMSDEPREQSDE